MSKSHTLAILFGLDGVQVTSVGAQGVPDFFGYPEGIDASQPADLGVWLAAEMSARGMKQRKAVVLVQRREIASRQIKFPTVLDASRDLPGMVQLEMDDQTAASRSSIVDFIHLTPQGRANSQEGSGATVFASAIPQIRYDTIRAVLEAAGIVVKGLSPLGISLAQSVRHDGPALLIAQTLGGLEIVFTDEDALPTRHIWLPTPVPQHDAEGIGNEFQRMLIMQQIDPAALPTRAIVIPDDPADTDSMRNVFEQVLGINVETLPNSNFGSLAYAGQSINLNFADPTRAPDVGTQRRQITMGAVLGCVVLAGVSYTAARQHIRGLERVTRELAVQVEDAEKSRIQRVRQAAIQEHTERWLEGGVDPVSEISRLVSRLPSHQELFLNEFALVAAPELRYERQRRESTYDARRWRSVTPIRVDLRGAGLSQQVIYDTWQSILMPGDLSIESLAADGSPSTVDTYPSKFEVRINSTALTNQSYSEQVNQSELDSAMSNGSEQEP